MIKNSENLFLSIIIFSENLLLSKKIIFDSIFDSKLFELTLKIIHATKIAKIIDVIKNWKRLTSISFKGYVYFKKSLFYKYY